MTNNSPTQQVSEISFGWDRHTDEQSIKAFLQKFSSDEFLAAIIPRLTDQELIGIVDQLSEVMRNHLSEQEYHRLFLSE